MKKPLTLIGPQEQIMGVGCTANIYAATAEQRTQETSGQKPGARDLRKEGRRDTAIHRMTGDTPPEKDGPSGAKRSTEGCSK